MTTCPQCGAMLAADHRFCPFDGTPVDDGSREGSLVGRVLSERYRIMARLGEGGMATVYLARHEHLQRDVALKVLRPHVAEDPKLIARFIREGRAASRIDHENVVYVLDFGRSEPGFFFLVMEHVVGRSLEEEIAQCGRISPARTTHILAQVVAVLARAHELGIVHRDVKPDNVLLCRRGRDDDFAKVLDFGLAALLESDRGGERLTSAGDIFGTPEYMAPEQWNGEPADARSDIYAVGVMAHQMLTGQLPFSGGALTLMLNHCNETPPVPSETLPGRGIPVIYDEVVGRCMAKEPARRYQTAGELLEALGHVWTVVDPPAAVGLMTTYATTHAAPPVRQANSIPDPGNYRMHDIDVIHDVPSLSWEIQHLHLVRERRVEEVMQALWNERRPARVNQLQELVVEMERAVANITGQVAVLQSVAEESVRAAAEQRAALRTELMDASLSMSGLGGLVDDAAAVLEDQGGADELARPSPLDRAERRLVSFDRSQLRAMLEIERELADRLLELRDREGKLAPLYDELAHLIADAAVDAPRMRVQLLAYEQVDGALASYKALLDTMEV